MITVQKPPQHKRRSYTKRKGQALVELALMGVFLGLLLAGAVDFGRAYYTSVVVTNMAGEGAAYAALYPDQDFDPANPTNGACSRFTVSEQNSIQGRARKVAKERGLVIDAQDQAQAVISVTTDGYGSTCQARCDTRTVTVRVTYTLDDLFLPGFLGITRIPITKSASQTILRNVYSGACPTS